MKIRIDIWLHRARLYKSRTQATAACREGRILINEKFADAGDTIEEGITIKVREHGLYRAYRILEAADINLSKQDAKRMYEEVTDPDALEKFRQVEMANRDFRAGAKKNETSARPTKKNRRDMNRLRGKG